MLSALSVTYSDEGERGRRSDNINDIDSSDHIHTSIAVDGNVISSNKVATTTAH